MSQALISQVMIGFSVAAILAIAAIGLAVIFGVAGVINMAHGQFIMVGAYTAAVVGQLGRFVILETGRIVTQGSVKELTDAVVKKHLQV